MLLHRPKSVGAPLAQIALLQQAKNPTHGVVAGARDNTPPLHWRSNGAVVLRAHIQPHPLCASSALPSATLAAAPLVIGRAGGHYDKQPTWLSLASVRWARKELLGRHTNLILQKPWNLGCTLKCQSRPSNLKINSATDLVDTVQTRDHARPKHAGNSAKMPTDHTIEYRVKGIYARALSRPLTLLEAVGPARAAAKRENARAASQWDRGQKNPGGGGGGREISARPISRPAACLSRPLFQNLVR
jgi:hypothetical protein